MNMVTVTKGKLRIVDMVGSVDVFISCVLARQCRLVPCLSWALGPNQGQWALDWAGPLLNFSSRA